MRSLIIAIAAIIIATLVLLVIEANQVSAEIVNNSLEEKIITKGTLIAEWTVGKDYNQVYLYKGKFYGCMFMRPQHNLRIPIV